MCVRACACRLWLTSCCCFLGGLMENSGVYILREKPTAAEWCHPLFYNGSLRWCRVIPVHVILLCRFEITAKHGLGVGDGKSLSDRTMTRDSANSDTLKIQTHKRFKRTLFISTKHSMRMFGVTPFFKQQNNTWTTVKLWKNEMYAKTKDDKYPTSHFSQFTYCLSVVL